MAEEFSPTPTQELILDVLVARHRLGETVWPVSSRHRAAVEALERAGMVTSQAGNVERTIRVSLTPSAVDRLVEPSYFPSGFRQQAENIAAFLDSLGVEPAAGRIIRANYGHAAVR